MPEGDTITRTARTLDRALRGEIVTALESPLPALAAAIGRHRLLGQQVAAVDAHGKHLLLRFSDGALLHTHQGMRGEWHLYRPRRARQRPASLARVVLETPNVVAVCFGAPVVEILSPLAQRGHSWLRRLGPDPLHASFDASAGVRRLRERGGREIGVALLDQGGIAGVGNASPSCCSCAASARSRPSPSSRTPSSSGSWQPRRASCGATWGPVCAARHPPSRPRRSGSTGAPDSRAAAAGRPSRGGFRASRRAPATGARAASPARVSAPSR